LQAAVKIDKSRRFRICALQLAFDPEFANERENWLGALKTLRSKFEEKIVLLNRADNASNPVRSFEKCHADAEVFQPVRAHEP
jgi:hypothetical protein